MSQKVITDYGHPIAPNEKWTQEGANDRLLHFVIETKQVWLHRYRYSPTSLTYIVLLQSIRIIEHPTFCEMMMYQALRGRQATLQDVIGQTKLTTEIESASKAAEDEIAQKFKVFGTLSAAK